MCGIAGYVDFANRPDPAILSAMARALARRGPDAQNTLQDGPSGFAHTRLSIIDVDGSPQPMAVSGSDVSLVYNGELYNYPQLRDELQATGEVFATQGDTEVVLRWVAREWDKALPRFDAMFALAAWDRRRQRLLLARDPLGEKPLFYATPAPGLLVYGSEPKAVLEHPAVDRALNHDALRQAVRFRAVYGDRCLHAGVSQLEPGAWLEFSKTGLKIGRYHDAIVSTAEAGRRLAGLSDQDIVQQGWDLFFESVRERLIADVPVGAFLSGGLDSSLIVAAMRNARGPEADIRTFSVGFSDDPNSELPYAKIVADRFGTSHTPITVGPASFAQRLSELSACRDAPVSEPADVAVAEMSQIARRSVKVVLSGEGADEVFAGYPKYRFAAAPRLFRAGLRAVGARRASRLAGRIGVNSDRALIAARALSHTREVDRIAQWFSYMDQRDLKRLLPGLGWTDADWNETVRPQQEALARMTALGPLARMQTADCLTWLPGNMLERGDRMTMAEGLEMRPPFLDKALVAFGLALPDRLKVRGGAGKWIVRQWAAQVLPPEIVQRRKWGFRVPLDQWFRGPLRSMLHDYLLSADGLCGTYGDRAEIARFLDGHANGEFDASTALWTLLSVEVWYQDVFRVRSVRHDPAEMDRVGAA